MPLQSLDIVRRSATTLPEPEIRGAHTGQVAKLIDTTKCIGCKACQVACMEWNDLRDEIGTCTGHYDNPHDLSEHSWTLMRFAEYENPKGDLEWLIRKDGCMHCEDPGCLKACPSPGAIVQYANGIVDFQEENCIGCGYCVTGCPFDVPRISKKDQKAYKCTLCSDPVGVGGTHVMYVLHHADQPALYSDLPDNPKISPTVRLWKGAAKPLALFAMAATAAVGFLHYIGIGPNETDEGDEEAARRDLEKTA